MAYWESSGKSDHWYTPKYIFDALECTFDMDVASATGGVPNYVPAKKFIGEKEDGLRTDWEGVVWMNPPFGGRNGLVPWIEKFIRHGNGIALVPDRTSPDWYHTLLSHSRLALMIRHKVKFINGRGEIGKSPSTGTTLFAMGTIGSLSLITAQHNGLGTLCVPCGDMNL